MCDTKTIIAAAQMCARDGDIAYNLREHERLIRLAAEHGIELLSFPEMSVTGYVREQAEELAFCPQDLRLDGLRALSARYHMIIIAGAPIRLSGDLHIGEFVIFPSGTEALYTKHYIHLGEEVYFAPNQDYTPEILLHDERISLAICFDIENEQHIAQAKIDGCTFLMPSIFYSEPAMDDAHRLLATYAGDYTLPVLMSNFSGYHYHTQSGGRSAFWSAGGAMLACLDKNTAGLVIAVKEDGVWTGKTAFADSDVNAACPV